MISKNSHVKKEFFKNNLKIDQNIDTLQYFVLEIMNGMEDWVRVIDKNNTIIFANNSLIKGLGKNPVGEKCYESFGKNTKCTNCTSINSICQNEVCKKQEFFNDKIYSVVSSPIKNNIGETISAVEVLRDITENVRLTESIQNKNNLLNFELKMAKNIQLSILPNSFEHENLLFEYIYKPCATLSGDFLDIYKIRDNIYGVYIADVAGHGVSASLLTMFLRSSIDKQIDSPEVVLKNLYRKFNDLNFDTTQYLTIFYAIIDIENYTLTYSNAGHNSPPILFNNITKSLRKLISSGIPISNWSESPHYKNTTIKINPNDQLLMYTDGIIEISNEQSIEFGESNILELILNYDQHPKVVLKEIMDKAFNFANIQNENHLKDDITISIIKIY